MLPSKEHQLNSELEMYKSAQQLAEDIKALQTNPVFQRVIVKSFCVDAVVENMDAFTNMNLSEELRQSCLVMAQSGAYLKKWLDARLQIGKVAEANIRKIMEAVNSDDDDDCYNDEERYQ